VTHSQTPEQGISPSHISLPTQKTKKTDLHSPAGFEPGIPASERPQTHVLERAVITYRYTIFWKQHEEWIWILSEYKFNKTSRPYGWCRTFERFGFTVGSSYLAREERNAGFGA